MRKLWKSLFLSNRLFWIIVSIVVLFILGQYFQFIMLLAKIVFSVLIVLLLLDTILLYHKGSKTKIKANRSLPERFSNGDVNAVTIYLQSSFTHFIAAELIDELPVQFQKRDFKESFELKPFQQKTFTYEVKPVTRGEYHFGGLNVIATTPIKLICRRYIFNQDAMVKVYPSFLAMKKFELMAVSNRLTELGIKRIRKVGHQMEFDQIREYITGDDFRTINWKATARKGHLMINQYQDERSQQVFNLIDMGRNMKMPFSQMTLLDYAINTSLVMSKIAMLKHDKAGLITFSNKIHSMLKAEKHGRHMQSIMEVLYNQETEFKEQDLQLLYRQVRHKINQRSLLILYTNFESLSSARRQIPFLQSLSKDHLLVVVFFENTEVTNLANEKANSVESIYVKTIAEKFIYDKKLIVRELKRHGIHAILTSPQNLTVNTINKYLEIKARGLL